MVKVAYVLPMILYTTDEKGIEISFSSKGSFAVALTWTTRPSDLEKPT